MRRGANVSDEGASDGAARAGEGARLASRSPLLAVNPWEVSRSLNWQVCPMLYFRNRAPICETCGEPVFWVGGPTVGKIGDTITYRVRCNCGEDEITTDWPLRIGGTAEEWKAGGYRVPGAGPDCSPANPLGAALDVDA